MALHNFINQDFKTVSIQLNSTTLEKPFAELSGLLTNKKFLQYVQTFTTNWVKYMQFLQVQDVTMTPNNRTLLTSFMIVAHPQVVLADLKTYMDSDLEQDAKTFVQAFFKLQYKKQIIIQDWSELYHLYQAFKQTFYKWKQRDKRRLLKPIIQYYHQTQQNMQAVEKKLNPQQKNDSDLHPETLKDLKQWRQKTQTELLRTKKRLIVVGGPEALQALQKYKPPSLEEKVNEIAHQAIYKTFWSRFQKDLEHEPPVFSQVPDLLISLKKMLCKLTPSRKDIHQEFDKYVDVEHIKQMLQHGIFDRDTMMTLIEYFVNQIKKFQSSADDKDTEEWRKNLQGQFNRQEHVSVILPNFFRIAFLKIQQILKQSEWFRNKMNLKNKSTTMS